MSVKKKSKPVYAFYLFLFSLIFYAPRLVGEPVRIVDQVIAKDSSELPAKIFSSDIIYVGENHNQYGNHLKQLDIIKAVYNKKKGAKENLVVAMEMFSSGDQTALDNYIFKKTDEITFLKESRYFRQWGYDYVLYRDILRFCKKKGIRVLGLNAEKKLTSTIYRSGLAKLTSKEMQKLPEFIEFNNDLYMKRLYNIYNAHPGAKYYDFRNFYLAQLVWDETMAENIASFLLQHRDATIIVLVGNGHIEYGDGIPERVDRRIRQKSISILLNSTYAPGAADYFIYTKEVSYRSTPVLGVYLEESENRLMVTGFTDQSAEDTHFLKKGDTIIKINGAEITNIADVRIALYRMKPDEEIAIELIRDKVTKTVRGPLQVQPTPHM
ncbi:MAG: ChaN family lipoprotein [Leptospirales bacterium]